MAICAARVWINACSVACASFKYWLILVSPVLAGMLVPPDSARRPQSKKGADGGCVAVALPFFRPYRSWTDEPRVKQASSRVPPAIVDPHPCWGARLGGHRRWTG